MYGPLEPASSTSSPSGSSSITCAAAFTPWSTKIFTADAGIRALGAMRRKIESTLRWMSSTSVTAGPGLMILPIQRSLSFSSPISITRRNSSELPSKYFLSPGLVSASPSRSLLSIFVAKNRDVLLSSFMGVHPSADWIGWFGDKDSNLDEQLQRLLSYH